MLKFSANLSMLFTEVPLSKRFGLARQAGFKAVEIQFPYELSIHELQTLLEKNQLELVLFNIPAGDLLSGGNGLACVPGKEAEYQAAIQKAVTYAKALNTPAINILSGRQPSGVSQEECFTVFEKNIRKTLDAFHGMKTCIVTEVLNSIDMPNILLHDLNKTIALCHRFPELRIQYDCYHMAKMERDIMADLNQHLSLIGHIQFADNPGRQQPGTGHLNFDEIFQYIQKADYTGYCGAEYRPSCQTIDSLSWFRAWKNGLKADT